MINRTQTPSVSQSVLATRFIFLVCGLGVSSWAPMVPYAKERLQLNDAGLGVLLLFLGAGAITLMPVSGWLSHRFGSRIVILISGLCIALSLPSLLLVTTAAGLGAMLFIFGAAIGTIDVAMNIHGVQVQRMAGRAIMSSLHGLFSVGGLFGSLGLGLLVAAGPGPVWAVFIISLLLAVIVVISYYYLLRPDQMNDPEPDTGLDQHTTSGSRFGWLHKRVLFLGVLCFLAFLAEGAMLDWSAIFLRENRSVTEGLAGMGYAAFSVAMAVMRLVGDKIIAGFSAKTVVAGGAIVAGSGLLLAVFTPWTATAILGFILLGVGAANIVPVLFSEAGRLPAIPVAVALPAITTLGYAGQLAGPAILGLIAHRFSLPVALGATGMMMFIIAGLYLFKKDR